ncbi:response regulator transcription factor [Reyranella soli]|uniref:DNA-binding response regulator n=1 Tax=Reyranella soli TaxID=1230389 RepID=A0A512NRT2_9HYPH|nr:response regulator transcription factor [Reyranella soli]GEP61644.1 DNA-binding response regulator [Reyranella soli]
MGLLSSTALSNGIEAKIALLDWTLPEMSGLELLGALKERRIGLPVVFLTGHSKVERELQALDRGAVDFVDKARGTDILVHRLRVLLDGHRQISAAAMPEIEHHGKLVLYLSMARALWLEQDVSLTITEYKVVALLVSSKASLHTYRAIYDAAHYTGFVAGNGEHGYTTNVRSLVKRIRRKFLAMDPGFSAIKNVPSLGYTWLDDQARGAGEPLP